MAAAFRLLLRQHAAPPPSPLLRSLFPASYSSKAAAAATASLPSVCRTPLPPPPLREVTPRKAPPIPKGEPPNSCKTVPSTTSCSTKSLLGKLMDLKDSTKSLQDMKRNIEEHTGMARKGIEDRKAANASFRKRLDDLRKLLAKLRNERDYSGKMDAMYCRLEDEYDRDWASQEAKVRFSDEQMDMLLKEREDYVDALRRYHELERSTVEQVEKVKKFAKVGAAVGLVGGLLLILAKI